MHNASLANLGWNDFFQHALEAQPPGTHPFRILAAHRGRWLVSDGLASFPAVAAGRLLLDPSPALPAVGDWVLGARPGTGGLVRITGVLPRSSCLRRRAAGPAPELQVLAANVDWVLLVCGLDGDFNPRRLERGLVLAAASGARAALVLTKADLGDPAPAVAAVRALAPEAPVLALSAMTGLGLEALAALLRPGATCVLLGSSGVGKSTLLNALLGEARQAVLPVRAGDDRGVHTTTHRELFRLPGGALLIDTPGLRELQLWGDEAVAPVFADVAAFAQGCRFRDCRHAGEPGCAVGQALADGILGEDRLASYRKLERERTFRRSQEDPQAFRERKAQERRFHRQLKQYNKGR